MANKKLEEAGKELGVSEKDIVRIRRQRLKARLFYPILGVIIVACFYGLGYVAGGSGGGSGYPYATPGLALVTGPRRKEEGFKSFIFILVTVLLSIAGFVAGYKAGHHHGGSAMYHVFSRQK
jgi:hypothetical protein